MNAQMDVIISFFNSAKPLSDLKGPAVFITCYESHLQDTFIYYIFYLEKLPIFLRTKFRTKVWLL